MQWPNASITNFPDLENSEVASFTAYFLFLLTLFNL